MTLHQSKFQIWWRYNYLRFECNCRPKMVKILCRTGIDGKCYILSFSKFSQRWIRKRTTLSNGYVGKLNVLNFFFSPKTTLRLELTVSLRSVRNIKCASNILQTSINQKQKTTPAKYHFIFQGCHRHQLAVAGRLFKFKHSRNMIVLRLSRRGKTPAYLPYATKYRWSWNRTSYLDQSEGSGLIFLIIIIKKMETIQLLYGIL
jgi:hypothetical protein